MQMSPGILKHQTGDIEQIQGDFWAFFFLLFFFKEVLLTSEIAEHCRGDDDEETEQKEVRMRKHNYTVSFTFLLFVIVCSEQP